MGIKSLHNKHAGQECAILLNGPSLDDHDLAAIDCTTIGVNRSWVLHDADYHVAIDDSHWKQFSRIRGDVRQLAPLITGPDGPEHAIRIPILDQHPPVTGWSWDMDQGAYLCFAVTFFTLQVVAYMGFSRIYLLGLDLCTVNGRGKFRGHPANAWPSRIERIATRQLQLMSYAAGKLRGKAEVFNLSPISKCEAFQKTTFEEVFLGRHTEPQQTITTAKAGRNHSEGQGDTGRKGKAASRKGKRGKRGRR